jgi:hypothetical protein
VVQISAVTKDKASCTSRGRYGDFERGSAIRQDLARSEIRAELQDAARQRRHETSLKPNRISSGLSDVNRRHMGHCESHSTFPIEGPHQSFSSAASRNAQSRSPLVYLTKIRPSGMIGAGEVEFKPRIGGRSLVPANGDNVLAFHIDIVSLRARSRVG